MEHQLEAASHRLVDGDADALSEIYRRTAPSVRSYLRRFVPEAEVDDLLQTVYFELWRNRRRYDPSRSVEAFTFTIARNRAVDYLRKRKNVVIDVEAIRELMGDDGREQATRFVESVRMRNALDRLGDDQRVALEMAYFSGLSQQEIATRLGVPIGTIKAHMARGTRQLAALMHEEVQDAR